MWKQDTSTERMLEIALTIIVLSLTCLLYKTVGFKMVVLNLFYLPVVLAGFFLGRYRAGVLALLGVVTASVVIAYDFSNFAAITSPLVIGMSLAIWGSVLGLTALLVGTLCDERDTHMLEAHEAHVGVVEVLSRYLQSANPRLQIRSRRVAALSEKVAEKMRLSAREIDDIRVAALLLDMESIEITARVIKKAVGELEDVPTEHQRTFHGTELVESLGNVLTGAFPLLLKQHDNEGEFDGQVDVDEPFGSRIIRTVRAYDVLRSDVWGGNGDPLDAIEELESDLETAHHPAVLHALRDVVSKGDIEVGEQPKWIAQSAPMATIAK